VPKLNKKVNLKEDSTPEKDSHVPLPYMLHYMLAGLAQDGFSSKIDFHPWFVVRLVILMLQATSIFNILT